MAVKGRQQYGRGALRKTSSTTLVLYGLIMLSLLIVILLSLGILSIHGTTSKDSPKAHDLSFIAHNSVHSIAEPHMEKSTVVDSDTGKSTDSSSGTFLARGRDKIVRNIEKRIADFTFIPVEQGEGLQILHYEVGQKYAPHYDYFMDEFNTQNGGQRIATVLMYLSDVEEGGETVFPAAKGNYSSVPWWNELSECGKGGLSVKPKMGDALLFWSMKPDATLDPSSLHGGCPVIKGNKWSSTKWMRVHEYKA
ncbi:hypothetical protein BUALT_Bualt11G0042500 [Buddleja alternifolia]|uniref:procollagen-proline 4-dioxygenase n=1 Tax=Buddleja alternifolia TaxID=168488 RepID=A0AAV6X3A8_9LAMI|nr:hypothetical protein BUALT_Bualt11G0042500 [Buddleja alternifolia]